MTDALVDSVRRVPGVGNAEARPVVMARLRRGNGDWVPAVLFVVRDFQRQRLDLFEPDRGAWPPPAGGLLLERSALLVAGANMGDKVTIRTIDGADHALAIAGIAHAPGLPPAWMEHMASAFVPWSSPLRATESEQIRIVVAAHELDEGWIHEVADSISSMLVRSGRTVSRVTVPAPGRHPHAGQMAGFLYLLGAFGVLSFLLGGVLAAGTVNALLVEQTRQVGILKAIGASTGQVAALYLAYVLVLALAALLIGLPSGIALGSAYARFAAGILNADVAHTPFPVVLVVAQAIAGLLVPLAMALMPLWRASRITVREALADEGSRAYGVRLFERWLASWRALPRPFALSLRTTFQRPGRLALAVLTLAIGGAAFIAALDVADGWNGAVRRDFDRRRYDLTLQLVDPVPIAALDTVLRAVPDVARAEYWGGTSGYIIGRAGVATNTVALVGPDPGSTLLALKLDAGRWLRPGDSSAAVINQAVIRENSALRVGGAVSLRLKGRTLTLPIVGVVHELSPMAVVYAPRAAVLAASGGDGTRTRLARLVTRRRDLTGERDAARAVEAAMAREGFEVAGLQRMTDAQQGILDHLVIIQSMLLFATVVVVLVGVLALASTLALSVVQRTREIGILGAIGARPRTIASHVWAEAMLMGCMSWLVANLLAVPLAWLLESATGRIFFGVPLDFSISFRPSLVWLGLVLVLATVCSLQPAWRASRLTIREALAHA